MTSLEREAMLRNRLNSLSRRAAAFEVVVGIASGLAAAQQREVKEVLDLLHSENHAAPVAVPIVFRPVLQPAA